MQARICSPRSHSEAVTPPLAPQLLGDLPFSHRAWLHCVTAFRRARLVGKGFQAIALPTVRVQVRRRGETLCGRIVEPFEAPNGAELYRVDLADLGTATVQARNCRACPPDSCWCRRSA